MGRPKAVQSLAETPVQGGRNWLIYSDSGAGKTVLAGTAPNALMLMFEAAGAESAKMFGSDADQWIMEDADTFREAYRYFSEGTGCDDYEWVVVDSLTELEDFMWASVLEDHGRQRHQPAKQDYPEVWNRMKDVVDKWNRLPINVLYTAHAFRLGSTDEEGDDDTILLPLVGSTKRGDTAQKICGKVTLVGYLDVRRREAADGEETFRRLWIEKTARMFAKSRHHKGVRYLDEPAEPDVYLDIADMNKEINARLAREKKRAAKEGQGREQPPNSEPVGDDPDEKDPTDSGAERPRRRRRVAPSEGADVKEEAS